MKILHILLALALLGQTSCSTSQGQSPTPTPPPPVFKAVLHWDANDPADNVISYVIYERFGSANFTYASVAVITAPTLTATVSGLPSGLHTWVATAINDAGESGYSNPASVTVPKKPNPPANFGADLVKGP